MMDTFGERLKYLIKTSEYKTVKEFAEKAGMHKGSVSNIIRGINKPSYDVIISCLSLFKETEVLWLLTGNMNDLQEKIQKLERENIEAKRELDDIKTKLKKFSGSRKNPQLTFPGFENGISNGNFIQNRL